MGGSNKCPSSITASFSRHHNSPSFADSRLRKHPVAATAAGLASAAVAAAPKMGVALDDGGGNSPAARRGGDSGDGGSGGGDGDGLVTPSSSLLAHFGTILPHLPIENSP